MTNPSSLWQVTVTTTVEAEDEVVELLERVTGQSPVSYQRDKSRKVTVTAYLPKPLASTPALLRRWTAGLHRLREDGVSPGPARLSQKEIPHEDWTQAWKKHIRPLEIGPALLVKPSWSERKPRPGQAIIVLDPGLSFGTGDHPTTGFCLRQVVACRQPGRHQALLDLGTGTGILAIAAAKLGYQPVCALDFDPKAVEVARENAQQNEVARKIQIRQQDITRLPQQSSVKFEVVCANLERDLLISEAPRIIARLQTRGTLLLAGILTRQFRQVQEAYESLGLSLVAHETKKEWRSGAFRFSAKPLEP
jgi:ribosomal protein L11 methyltransferase